MCNHPTDLTAQALITRRVELPLDWRAQKTALHICERWRRGSLF